MDYTLFIILICASTFIFTMGMVSGVFISNRRENFDTKQYYQNLSINKDKLKNNNNLLINDAKIVLGISTDGLQKKFENIGETTTQENDTNNSINKLKNMKGK